MGRGIICTLSVLVVTVLLGAAPAIAVGPAGTTWDPQQLIGRVRAANAKAPNPGLPLPFTAQLVLPGEVLLDPVVVTDAELTSAGASTTWDEVDQPQQYVVGPLFSPTCPNAQYPTINAAVIAAPPGAVIKVCPGVYAESVLADKSGQTIRALARADDGAHSCAPGDPATDPARYAIVLPPLGSPGFSISADRVVIDGFVVEGGSSGVETLGTASGYDIRRNILQKNDIGIALNSNGTLSSRARHNCTRNNFLGAAAFGTSNVGIENNFVQANSHGVWLLFDSGGVRVSHNTLTQNGAGIEMSVEQNTFIGDNRVSAGSDPSSAAIFAQGSTGLTIERNALDGPGYAGILVDSSAAANTVVRKNRVRGFGTDPLGPGAGILLSSLLSSTSGTLVQGNRTDLNGHGIQLGDGATLNQVRGNSSLNNSGSGIRAEILTSNNTIEGNKALGNNPDCYDESAGAGTAGTANVWRGNIGRSENRPGLCKRRTSDD